MLFRFDREVCVQMDEDFENLMLIRRSDLEDQVLVTAAIVLFGLSDHFEKLFVGFQMAPDVRQLLLGILEEDLLVRNNAEFDDFHRSDIVKAAVNEKRLPQVRLDGRLVRYELHQGTDALVCESEAN